MILNLLGFLIAYPFGIVAVTWAYVIRFYIAFPVGQWAISKLLKITWSEYLRQFIPSFLGSIIMITAIFSLKIFFQYWLFSLLFCSMIGLIIYATAIDLIAPQLIQQLIELFKLANSRKKIET